MVSDHTFSQEPYACRFFWGPEGAMLCAQHGDIVVIVDVLSFSTAIAVAVSRGAEVIPAATPEDAAAYAEVRGAVVLPGRRQPTAEGWSHSPCSLRNVPPSTRLAFFSPNGGRCAGLARGAARVLVGGLVNASAVAARVQQLHHDTGLAVSVVACGERWSGSGTLRPSLEDAVGSGAIIARLGLACSPEAAWVAGAYGRVPDWSDALWDCGSGRELRARGFPEDVRLASAMDSVGVAAEMGPDGWLRANT